MTFEEHDFGKTRAALPLNAAKGSSSTSTDIRKSKRKTKQSKQAAKLKSPERKGKPGPKPGVKAAANKRAVDATPLASELCFQDITSLLFKSRVPRAYLKSLFREGLAIKGYKRGQIPVMLISEDGDITSTANIEDVETKMMSRCSAEELGAYLAFLLSRIERALYTVNIPYYYV